jgi:hypothetical protein
MNIAYVLSGREALDKLYEDLRQQHFRAVPFWRPAPKAKRDWNDQPQPSRPPRRASQEQ